jgi:hypothetical protein
MGIELVRSNEICGLSVTMWHECLELAKAFGWKPAGTRHPITDLSSSKSTPEEKTRRQREWEGGYTTNDWQRVTDVDAYAMAMALYRAIAAREGPGKSVDRENLKALKRVADFVRKGSFEIA